MTPLRCPHCGCTSLARCKEIVEGGGEKYEATHRCLNEKCGLMFKYVPPTYQKPSGAAS